MVETRRRELADPALPLGMIERGRGAGFLWAREHPEEARLLLHACLVRDRRSLPRFEPRTEYFMELAQAIGFGAHELKPLLAIRAAQPVWSADTGDDPPFTLLAGLALAGDRPVRALVHAQIREGPNWITILEHIGWLAAARESGPFPVWLELAEAVLARVAGSDDGKVLQEHASRLRRGVHGVASVECRREARGIRPRQLGGARGNRGVDAVAADDVVVIPTEGYLARQAAAELGASSACG